MQKILDVINTEIGFHSDITNPWYWRWICRIFKKRECHEVLVRELLFLKRCLEPPFTRVCADCGEAFDPINGMDWFCKPCLLKRYESTRPKVVVHSDKEPELTDSAPGGS